MLNYAEQDVDNKRKFYTYNIPFHKIRPCLGMEKQVLNINSKFILVNNVSLKPKATSWMKMFYIEYNTKGTYSWKANISIDTVKSLILDAP